VLCHDLADAGTVSVDIRQTAYASGRFTIHVDHPTNPTVLKDWPGVAQWSGHFFNFFDDPGDAGVDINLGEFHLLTRGETSDGGIDLDNMQVYSDRARTSQLLDYSSPGLGCSLLRN